MALLLVWHSILTQINSVFQKISLMVWHLMFEWFFVLRAVTLPTVVINILLHSLKLSRLLFLLREFLSSFFCSIV